MRLLLLLTVALCLGSLEPARAADQKAAIKAAMIYNFTRFATWGRADHDPSRPVVICVAPSHPLAAALAAMEGQPVDSRRLHVQTINPAAAQSCNVAVLTNNESDPETIQALHRRGMLTVGETSGFARTGAIQLVSIGREIRFAVNTKAASAAGVKLSSRLLRVAVDVK